MLDHDQLYYVSFCEDHDSIRLAITPDDDGITVPTPGVKARWDLIEYFNNKLVEMVKTFMPASDLPQRYIPCSRCPKLHNHLKLDHIRKTDKPLRCDRGKLLEDYYYDLRKKYQGNSSYN